MTSLADCVDIPPHVPDNLVFDFDFAHDPLLSPDPFRGLQILAGLTPELFFTPRYGGHWVARSYASVFDIAQKHGIFSSAFTGGIGRPLLPIMADPPEHHPYRKILMHAFAPKSVNAMVPLVHSVGAKLIGEVSARDGCEFVSEISEPLPSLVFMTMVGLPREHRHKLRHLVGSSLEEGDLTRREAIYEELLSLIDPVIQARIAEPCDDVISQLVVARVNGRPLTLEEIRGFVIFLTSAGLDTVTNALSFGLMHLARDAVLQDYVRARPELVPALVEELLRRYSVSSIVRMLTGDLSYGGADLRAGERVLLLIPAANMDCEKFADPDRIQSRRDVPAIAFGAGIHRCLGSHLARLELRFVITEFLKRIPAFRIDMDLAPRVHAGMTYTVDRLQLVWGQQR